MLLRLAVLLLSVVFAGSGFAESVTFHFDYATAGYSGSGEFTTSTTAIPGQYLVTGISGVTNGYAITGLLPSGNYPTNFGGANDNLFYYAPGGTSPYVDLYGISFATADGTDYNVFFGAYTLSGVSYSPWYYVLSGKGNVSAADAINYASIVPAPEPSSLLLLGTGVLGLAASVRRRFV